MPPESTIARRQKKTAQRGKSLQGRFMKPDRLIIAASGAGRRGQLRASPKMLKRISRLVKNHGLLHQAVELAKKLVDLVQ
jgi:hypothetical protein